MTAEAHHYDDLHRLIDRLNPGQADALRAVAVQFIMINSPSAADDRPSGDWPPSWLGPITSDEVDVAERSREAGAGEVPRSP